MIVITDLDNLLRNMNDYGPRDTLYCVLTLKDLKDNCHRLNFSQKACFIISEMDDDIVRSILSIQAEPANVLVLFNGYHLGYEFRRELKEQWPEKFNFVREKTVIRPADKTDISDALDIYLLNDESLSAFNEEERNILKTQILGCKDKDVRLPLLISMYYGKENMARLMPSVLNFIEYAEKLTVTN